MWEIGIMGEDEGSIWLISQWEISQKRWGWCGNGAGSYVHFLRKCSKFAILAKDSCLGEHFGIFSMNTDPN